MNKKGVEQEMIIRILVWIAIFVIALGGIWFLWGIIRKGDIGTIKMILGVLLI